MIEDVLKPKSIEEVKGRIKLYSDYRIKDFNSSSKCLQYKTKIKFLNIIKIPSTIVNY